MYEKFSHHEINLEDVNIKSINNMIELMNITDEAMRNYHYLWYTYINRQNFTLFCRIYNNCDEEILKFILAEENWHFKVIEEIRKSPEMGKLIEAESTSPPCTNEQTVKELKIEPICNLLKNVSTSKRAFLKLMKYTKQSPVFLEDQDDFDSISTYGYTLKNNTRVSNMILHSLKINYHSNI